MVYRKFRLVDSGLLNTVHFHRPCTTRANFYNNFGIYLDAIYRFYPCFRGILEPRKYVVFMEAGFPLIHTKKKLWVYIKAGAIALLVLRGCCKQSASQYCRNQNFLGPCSQSTLTPISPYCVPQFEPQVKKPALQTLALQQTVLTCSSRLGNGTISSLSYFIDLQNGLVRVRTGSFGWLSRLAV